MTKNLVDIRTLHLGELITRKENSIDLFEITKIDYEGVDAINLDSRKDVRIPKEEIQYHRTTNEELIRQIENYFIRTEHEDGVYYDFSPGIILEVPVEEWRPLALISKDGSDELFFEFVPTGIVDLLILNTIFKSLYLINEKE